MDPIESKEKDLFPPKIFIILILLAGIIGSFQILDGLVSKQEPVLKVENLSTDISDWKTYRNDEYGFEFKYSKELFLYESGSKIRLDTENLSYEGDNLSDITIFIIPKTKDGVEYWKNKVVKDLKVGKITIGGLIAHKVSGIFDNVFGFLDEIPYQVVIVDRGDDTIEVSNEISESNTLYIDQILSTLKFISTTTKRVE